MKHGDNKAGRAGWHTRTGLRRALGVLWLIAGALKFQPGLTDRREEAYSFAMTAMGAPAPVAREIVRVGQLLVGHPRLWWAIGVVEVAIGFGLLARRYERAALAASIIWGLGIWVLGEGFEGLSAGATSIATGFPGAAVLYVLVAVLVWPTKRTEARSVAAASLLRGPGAKVMWALLWLAAATVQLRSQGGPGGLDGTLFIATREEPGLIVGLDRLELHWLTFGHELLLSAVVALFCVLVTLMVVLDVVPRLALGAVMVVSIVFWVLGQNLGGLASGSATDVGTGPLLVLLAAAFWPSCLGHERTRLPMADSTTQTDQLVGHGQG